MNLSCVSNLITYASQEGAKKVSRTYLPRFFGNQTKAIIRIAIAALIGGCIGGALGFALAKGLSILPIPASPLFVSIAQCVTIYGGSLAGFLIQSAIAVKDVNFEIKNNYRIGRLYSPF